MSTQTTQSTPTQTVVSLSLRRLSPHPANPNRMSDAAFKKLVKHIERTGQYEPIVVRIHPHRKNSYQILNGHHRMRALARLSYTHADCVVFAAADAEAMVYLATLNKLTGRDNVHKKSRLIEQLCKRYESKELSQMLPESKTAIEKLDCLAKQQPLPKPKSQKPFLLPMTFFVTEPQHRLISEAFEKAVKENESGSRTEKRLLALCRIAKNYLGKDAF
ncbi:MAG: ParB N-terminal domain-containing protein [Phycisphaerae bacterium]|nr:ParB N-terminal domain-containing protein [Phycisphaerae bacterium]